MDTARTVTDLIFAGTPTRHPDIRLIIPHAGDALTAVAERIAAFSSLPFLNQRPGGGAAEVNRVLASLYYDLGGSASDAASERLRRLTSVTHILFGSDFPFTPAAGVEANVERFRALAGLTISEHEAIAKGNAWLFPRFARASGAERRS